MAGFAIAAFACGGKIEQGGPTPTPDYCASLSGNACDLVTQDQVNEALSSDLPAGQSGGGSCLFGEEKALELFVTIFYQCPTNGTDIQLSGATAITHLGDSAQWLESTNGQVGNLDVQYGNVNFGVSIFWPEAGEANVDDARKIAEDVIANL